MFVTVSIVLLLGNLLGMFFCINTVNVELTLDLQRLGHCPFAKTEGGLGSRPHVAC